MPTAAERMLELSALPPGNTARAHFLSIVQTTGGSFIASELEITMDDIEVELQEPITVELQEELEVSIEEPIEVEVS